MFSLIKRATFGDKSYCIREERENRYILSVGTGALLQGLRKAVITLCNGAFLSSSKAIQFGNKIVSVQLYCYKFERTNIFREQDDIS